LSIPENENPCLIPSSNPFYQDSVESFEADLGLSISIRPLLADGEHGGYQ
jgi:hypothetical protein